MRIVIAPDPILRAQAEPVSLEELPKLAKKAQQMAKLMYKSEGCGLAAPQVGISKRLIVVDPNVPKEGEKHEPNPVFLVNPVVKNLYGVGDVASEGCLSIPGITVDIERSANIELEAWDLEGNEISIEAEGFAARALQHELDHLDGITMFEHLDAIARIDKLKEYEQALGAGAKPGDTGNNTDGTDGADNTGDTGGTDSNTQN